MPPGLSGELRGWGRAWCTLDEATDEGGGESAMNPPDPAIIGDWGGETTVQQALYLPLQPTLIAWEAREGLRYSTRIKNSFTNPPLKSVGY